MPPKPRHPAVVAVQACLEDPRAQAALSFLDTLLPNTASHVRQLADNLPGIADAVADQARAQVVREAASLDRAVSRSVAGALDELLTAAGARTARGQRLAAGEKSRARQAARRGQASKAR